MKGIVIDLKDISDSREMMESEESPKIRWFIYILLTAVVVAVIFSYIFRIDEYSRVNGEIKTQEAASSVISMNNCKIKQICVTEGQEVKTGDILFLLDSEYTEGQKKILEDKMSTYNSNLANTELLKKSIEENKNLFKNTSEDSKFYYRYEQYKNGTLLTAQEIDNTALNDGLSKEDKENSLASTNSVLIDKKDQLLEYNSLISCIRNDSIYSGKNREVSAVYNEYNTNYQKAYLLSEQYRIAYESAQNAFDNQSSTDNISYSQVESAKLAVDNAYSSLNEQKNYYMVDIRSKIVILENQLANDNENVELQKNLNELNNLKYAIQQGTGFSSTDSTLQASYDNYITNYNALAEDYANKTAEYQRLYNDYSLQSRNVSVTDADVSKAKNAYETSIIDLEAIKNNYISQVQTKITALEAEIKSLDNNKKSLEVSLKNVKDLDTYEKLSADKLKNEAVVAVNSEIDGLRDNINSLKSQLAEIDETIKNSEIKATVDGTVTLISELSTGDIVQAGSSLCSIIPDSENLKVTLYIPEKEIAKVKIGQKTEYFIDAIPYDEYGSLTGEIISISADSVASESTGTKFYIAQASLSANSLTNEEGTVRELRTGMLLEAKSISGSKRVITWLLEKLNFID
ncbi:HlyD family efflux transporter periplasmic adaptor subunit [Ruminococcus flavefaciens]|uniref:Biotin/lipoyl-binding protein n=1 Tax=Ruminococcus flavefaciens TaxID=1265 RepID=A0A315XTI3_RUMFL|nr:HlyD family efflux transporter periplasmic adaptor subunit [Ruminococcus flavefaciens]PWJ09671.1 biotin/lipoyl-binding protein [Ruminococcus flavefaciens]SSA52289.1 Biotin-lipoyl like [Ruminococcus flavefaciens]